MVSLPPARVVIVCVLALSTWGCNTMVAAIHDGDAQPGFATGSADVEGGDVAFGRGERFDGQGQGPSNNTPPGPPTIALEPLAPNTKDDISVVFELDAIDPDEGPAPLTYVFAWFVNDQPTLHTAQTLPAEVTRRSELWRVEVTATDGADLGVTASLDVMIGNSPPTLDEVTLAPNAPDNNTPLFCQADDVDDADGDDTTVLYQWYIDEVPLDGKTNSALQPPLQVGGSYRCSGRPFDGQDYGQTVYSNAVVPSQIVSNEAILAFQPKSIDLGTVLPGEISTRELRVLNIGDGPLTISGIAVSGDVGFAWNAVLPLQLDPGAETMVEVIFTTSDPGLKKGTLSFDSDASNQHQNKVPLLGIGASPCLRSDPLALDFGGAYVASNTTRSITIESCGLLPATIDNIALDGPQDTPFVLDLSTGPGPLPWVLQAGETATFEVRFEPFQSSPTTEEGGVPIPETATVSLAWGLQPLLEIPVQGFASAAGCPVPVIEVDEGHFAGPGTLLHLNASNSIAPGGVPPVISWAVTAPDGVTPEPLLPAADVEVITYQTHPEALGTYLFTLKVFDVVEGNVVPGCGTATWTVTVKDAVPLIVELTWDTPGDVDQTDSFPGAGADLDLHMHNGQGQGEDYDGDGDPDTWFDFFNDLFWFDTSPEWGVLGPEDDPMLTIEDPDGAGPERLEWHNPILQQTVTLGVHCWSSFDYGPSVPTVTVYHFEEPVASYTGVLLSSGQLWEIGSFTWPNISMTPSFDSAGGPKLTSGYPNPFQ